MGRAWIDRENSFWRNALGVLGAVIVIPVAIVLALVAIPFSRPVQRSAEDVARCLRAFLDGPDDEGQAFDDFVCIPIADPRLDSIRKRVAALDLPLSGDQLNTYEALISEAEALAEKT